MFAAITVHKGECVVMGSSAAACAVTGIPLTTEEVAVLIVARTDQGGWEPFTLTAWADLDQYQNLGPGLEEAAEQVPYMVAAILFPDAEDAMESLRELAIDQLDATGSGALKLARALVHSRIFEAVIEEASSRLPSDPDTLLALALRRPGSRALYWFESPTPHLRFCAALRVLDLPLDPYRPMFGPNAFPAATPTDPRVTKAFEDAAHRFARMSGVRDALMTIRDEWENDETDDSDDEPVNEEPAMRVSRSFTGAYTLVVARSEAASFAARVAARSALWEQLLLVYTDSAPDVPSVTVRPDGLKYVVQFTPDAAAAFCDALASERAWQSAEGNVRVEIG